MTFSFPKTLTPLRVMRERDAVSALISIGRQVDDYICKADSEAETLITSALTRFADEKNGETTLACGCPVPPHEVAELLRGDCGKKLRAMARACVEREKDIYPLYARYEPFVAKVREFGEWFSCASEWADGVANTIRDQFIQTDIEGFWLDCYAEFRVPLGYYEEYMHRGCCRDIESVSDDVASFLKEARGTWLYDPDAKADEKGDEFGVSALDGVEIIGDDIFILSPKDAVRIAMRLVTECLDEEIDEGADTLYAVDYDKLAAEFSDPDEREYAEALADEFAEFYCGSAYAYIRYVREKENARWLSLSADVRGALEGWLESGARITDAIRPTLAAFYPVTLFVADVMERVGVRGYYDGEWIIGE